MGKMLMKTTFLLMILMLTSCGTRLTKHTSVLPDNQKESYAIYSQVLREEFAHHRSPFYISVKTVEKDGASANWFHYQNLLAPVTDETIGDYYQANKSEELLERKFENNLEYVLIDPKGWQKQLNQTRSLDRSCYISFSKIGFNRKTDQALVSTITACSGSSTGMSFLLSKEGLSWKIIKKTIDFEACG